VHSITAGIERTHLTFFLLTGRTIMAYVGQQIIP
jgi:hypothetical protein